MSFNDYFDQAFCINLDKRPDRWNRIQKRLRKINIDVERVSAVDGLLLPPSSIKQGAAGCRASHLEVFRIAESRGLDSFLLVEDDAVFDTDFNDKFDAISDQIPSNFIMLYLGSNPHSGTRSEYRPNVDRAFGAYAAHCVIFRRPCFDDIITKLSGPPTYPADVSYAELQTFYPSYVIKPALVWQEAGYSDIEQTEVDYDFMRMV